MSAPIVQRLRVSSGQPIEFDQTQYRTIEAGRLQVLSTTSISGRLVGPIHQLTRDAYYKGRFPQETVSCKEGDLIDYLQSRAEGTCFVRVAGQVIEADLCPAGDVRSFRTIAQPKIEWWIRVVVDRVGIGWAIVDDKTIKNSGRSF